MIVLDPKQEGAREMFEAVKPYYLQERAKLQRELASLEEQLVEVTRDGLISGDPGVRDLVKHALLDYLSKPGVLSNPLQRVFDVFRVLS